MNRYDAVCHVIAIVEREPECPAQRTTLEELRALRERLPQSVPCRTCGAPVEGSHLGGLVLCDACGEKILGVLTAHPANP